MAFACPFCSRVLSNRSAYSQHVKRCSENYDSSSSEEIFIQNMSFFVITPLLVCKTNIANRVCRSLTSIE